MHLSAERDRAPSSVTTRIGDTSAPHAANSLLLCLFCLLQDDESVNTGIELARQQLSKYH